MTTAVYFEKLDRLEELFGHKVIERPSRSERLRAALAAAVGAVRARGGLDTGHRPGAGHTSATSPS